MPKTATPWGPATVVEHLKLTQRVGDRQFASLVELLEDDRGERLVRFAYSSGGTARRGPVTLRARDVARLRTQLANHPELGSALALGGEIRQRPWPRPAPAHATGLRRHRTGGPRSRQ